MGGLAALLAAPAGACGLALMFAIDVSLSVDEAEYAIQIGGIGTALKDRDVAEALLSLEGGAALSLMQWSGRADQAISLPWTRIETATDLSDFAERIARTPRAFASETAPGSALLEAIAAHQTNPLTCDRRVTDVSGDGIQNTGASTRQASAAAVLAGHTVNGLVILGDDPRLEDFYRHNVIGGPGHFLEIARGFSDYPRAMREKLLKEIPMMVAFGTTDR